MLERPQGTRKPVDEAVIAASSTWCRCPASGVLRSQVALGDVVREGQVLGVVGDPLSENETPVESPATGVVIGRLNLPLVHEGDAIFHVARVDNPDAVGLAMSHLRERIAAARHVVVGEMPIV
jgi:predicted deacylase